MTIIYINNIIKIIRRKLINVLGSTRLEKYQFDFYRILDKNFPRQKGFSCILVGAHDGISHDLLYPFLLQREVSGIAIEPQKELFEKLEKNFVNLPHVKKINKAVHPLQKKILLYHVDPAKLSTLPSWASGIGSVYKDHHKKSGIESIYMIATEVQAEHLMELIRNHYGHQRIDLVQIDTEGFDLEVIKQVDFSCIKPKIIRFEYMNLTRSQINEAIRLLKHNGYYCFYEDMDVVAVDIKQVSL